MSFVIIVSLLPVNINSYPNTIFKKELKYYIIINFIHHMNTVLLPEFKKCSRK